jgi:hypothetical protein
LKADPESLLARRSAVDLEKKYDRFLAAENGERASRLSEDRSIILEILGSRVQPADRPANYTAAPGLETVSFLRTALIIVNRCTRVVLPGLAWDLVRAWLGQERKFSTTEQDTNSVIVEAAEATGGVAQGLDF